MVPEPRSPAPLPPADREGHVAHDGARLYYRVYGATSAAVVTLLHGGLGNGEDWGNQVPPLLAAGYRVILVDSRGHGRSTRDERRFGYERMAADILAVLDEIDVATTAIVGWSDGAILGVTLAMRHPERVTRVFAFGVNLDLTGNKPVDFDDPIIAATFARNAEAYARLSATPDDFRPFAGAVAQMMNTEPSYRADELRRLRVPIAIVAGEHDELITREHSEYLARTLPEATLTVLAGVSHFAPLQDPAAFDRALLAFLGDAV